MSDVSLMYYSDKLGKTQPRILRLVYHLASAAVTNIVQGYPVYTTFGAISAQSTIDNFLGTSSEFNYLAFDATSMGTDAFGFIVNMGGQCKMVTHMIAAMRSSTYLATTAFAAAEGGSSAALTATTLETAVAAGTSGNIAGKLVISSLDSTTALLQIEIGWIAN